MRAFLIDTHVWLWLAFDEPGKLSAAARTALGEAAERNGLAISQASIWEVSLKARKRRLDLPPDTRTWLARATRMPGIGVIELDREVLVGSTELDLPVRDPADRMIVATALKYDLILATADRNLLDFAARHPQLEVLDVTT
jgi:PIN domain nuclease of toxin-antitoxin system